MTEETYKPEQEQKQGMAQEEGGEEEPQIYSVKKGLTGWKFSRRDFLAAAATATAGATAAAMGPKDKPVEATSDVTKDVRDTIALTVAMPAISAVSPGESFAQVWQFTNHSDRDWCKGAALNFLGGEQMQAPASVQVPDIAPGQTVIVRVDMVAPVETGAYQGSWYVQDIHNLTPVVSCPFLILNGCIIESPHPYGNDMDQTWTVTNPDPNARSTRVHFSQVAVETGYDYIVLKDETGQESQRITGSYPSGLWSEPIPGGVVQVQLVSDATSPEWGFCLDQMETLHPVYLPIILATGPVQPTATKTLTPTPVLTKTPTPTPTYTPTPTPTCTCDCVSDCGCDCVSDCGCNCVSNSHYWYPN